MSQIWLDTLDLCEERVDYFGRELHFRIYNSRDLDSSGRIRWHFAFPEELVKDINDMLETEQFLGVPHWHKQDGYWFWWTMLVTEDLNPDPDTNKLLRFFLLPIKNASILSKSPFVEILQKRIKELR